MGRCGLSVLGLRRPALGAILLTLGLHLARLTGLRGSRSAEYQLLEMIVAEEPAQIQD
jgi:hypothetical protein